MILGLPLIALLACLVGGYLVGSIPFGVIVTRLGGAGDVRAIGSGNIGATNVLRTGRRDLALLTLLGDGGKGIVAVLVARALWGETAGALAGACAFLGHLFPVWLGFKGGKGVATFFGILIAAAWPVGLLAGATWIAVFAAQRISSLAALVAVVAAPIYAFLLHSGRPVIALALFTGVLIYIRHHENIRRLLKGEEPRFGTKTAKASPSDPTP
jgi:glycerol-3-phosphate acyltransferase PlsY